jgi:16S rRNA (uracil1498-N3)-methyltransferase
VDAVGPDGRDGPHLFVDDLADARLSGDDTHHLVRVLRAAVGDPLTVCDGDGRWAPARLAELGGAVEVTGSVVEVPAPGRTLTVAFAPVKGDRPEWTVQKLTEIGVDRIVAVTADRSVVRWSGDRADRQLDRLRRIAREAAMQSRRCRLPVIEGLRPARDLIAASGMSTAEPGGPPPTGAEVGLVVGPEGGWSPDELTGARATVGVGPHVLRAETAAVVGAALLVALRTGIVGSTTKRG